jgi:hypothetical protein
MAADSTWLVCKGTAALGTGKNVQRVYLAASLVEHRSAIGDTRDLTIALLRGAHVGGGEIRGQTAGDWLGKATKLEVTSLVGKGRVVFTGTAQLSTDMKSFELAGTFDPAFGLDPKGKRETLAAKLTCETLDDLAITP